MLGGVLADFMGNPIIEKIKKLYEYEPEYATLKRADYLSDNDQIRLLKMEAELPDLFREVLDWFLHFNGRRIKQTNELIRERRGKPECLTQTILPQLKRLQEHGLNVFNSALPSAEYNKCFIALDIFISTYHKGPAPTIEYSDGTPLFRRGFYPDNINTFYEKWMLLWQYCQERHPYDEI